MTDKEYRETQKRCAGVLRWWEQPLGLTEWHLKVVFHREAFEQNTAEGYRTQAACTSAWVYRDATIDIDVGACAVMDDDELERLLLHECGHILCAVIRGAGADGSCADGERSVPPGEERLCSDLAVALQRARQKGVKLGSRGA